MKFTPIKSGGGSDRARVRCRPAALAIVAWLGVACASSADSRLAAAVDDAPRIHRVSLFRYHWVWRDEQGRSVSFNDWQGQALVLSTFSTACPATCPRELKKMRELDEAYRREGHPAQFLVVTLDPVTDTPERLREFKQEKDLPDSWRLLAGSVEQTDDLAGVFDIHVMNTGPQLIHDTRIVIFDSQGMPTRIFSGLTLEDEAPIR